MSLPWTLITYFVYAEVATVLAMCLPLFSVQRWRRILRSRLLQRLDAWGNYYFNFFLFLLGILFLDAYRKLNRYSEEVSGHDERVNPHGFALARVRKFRAQSNLTLAGGALLLWVVLKFMVHMLIARAFVEADLEAEKAQLDQARADLAQAKTEAASLRRQLAAAGPEGPQQGPPVATAGDQGGPADKKHD